MSAITFASTADDANALETIITHHAELAGGMATHVNRVLQSASVTQTGDVIAHARALADWCKRELLPHALAEEDSVYASASALPELDQLITSMRHEHQLLAQLVSELATSDNPADLIAKTGAVSVLFDAHLREENELVLPALAANPNISLSALLDEMHTALTASVASEEAACNCGHTQAAADLELDARAVPHAIRHATVFGALDATTSGQALLLTAPHDPQPLLQQIALKWPDTFTVEYLTRGPEAWQLRLERQRI